MESLILSTEVKFANNKWFRLFCKRHSKFSQKRLHNLSMDRVRGFTKENIVKNIKCTYNFKPRFVSNYTETNLNSAVVYFTENNNQSSTYLEIYVTRQCSPFICSIQSTQAVGFFITLVTKGKLLYNFVSVKILFMIRCWLFN